MLDRKQLLVCVAIGIGIISQILVLSLISYISGIMFLGLFFTGLIKGYIVQMIIYLILVLIQTIICIWLWIKKKFYIGTGISIVTLVIIFMFFWS